MTLDLEKYAFTEGKTPLSAGELNPRFFAIVRRLHALELLSNDLDAAIAQVQNYGVARIENAVRPLADTLKNELAVLIAQGRDDLASQSAAVEAKLGEMDAAMAEAAAAIADITARIAAVEASQQQLVDETVPDIIKQAKRLALVFG